MAGKQFPRIDFFVPTRSDLGAYFPATRSSVPSPGRTSKRGSKLADTISVRNRLSQGGRPLPVTVRVQEFFVPGVIVCHCGALKGPLSRLHFRLATMQKKCPQMIE